MELLSSPTAGKGRSPKLLRSALLKCTPRQEGRKINKQTGSPFTGVASFSSFSVLWQKGKVFFLLGCLPEDCVGPPSGLLRSSLEGGRLRFLPESRVWPCPGSTLQTGTQEPACPAWQTCRRHTDPKIPAPCGKRPVHSQDTRGQRGGENERDPFSLNLFYWGWLDKENPV